MFMRQMILGASALILGISLTFNAFAKEETLARITSDIDRNYALLVYDRDDVTNEVKAMYADAYENGSRVERKAFDERGLNTGIVLLEKDRYQIVKIQSSNFDRDRGGIIKLDTLYSAVSGERRVYEFEISVHADRVTLETRNGEFNRMHFIAKRSRVLGPIGIEKIQFIKE